MSIIHRTTDLIKLKIGDLVFSIKPLSYMERTEIMGAISNQNGTVVENAAKSTFLIMRHSIRELEGATLSDGSKYELVFNEDKTLSDVSIDDLLNIASSRELSLSLSNFLKGIPTDLINPTTGEKIEGVEILPGKTTPKK